MKKILSTIGLAVALMTGFASSLAEAAISFVNIPAISDGIHPPANTWRYNLMIG